MKLEFKQFDISSNPERKELYLDTEPLCKELTSLLSNRAIPLDHKEDRVVQLFEIIELYDSGTVVVHQALLEPYILAIWHYKGRILDTARDWVINNKKAVLRLYAYSCTTPLKEWKQDEYNQFFHSMFLAWYICRQVDAKIATESREQLQELTRILTPTIALMFAVMIKTIGEDLIDLAYLMKCDNFLKETIFVEMFQHLLTIDADNQALLLRYLLSNRAELHEAAKQVLATSNIATELPELAFANSIPDVPIIQGIVQGLVYSKGYDIDGIVVPHVPEDYNHLQALRDNLIIAKSKEEVSPGIIRELYQRFGITQYARHTNTVMEYIISTRHLVDLPSILVVLARNHYGDYYIESNVVKYEHLIDLVNGSKYVRFVEVEHPIQIKEKIDQLSKHYGKFETIIMHGHGGDTLSLSPHVRWDMGSSSDGSHSLADVLSTDTVADGVRIIVDSCFSLSMFKSAKDFPVSALIFGSNKMSAIDRYNIDPEGNLQPYWIHEDDGGVIEICVG